MGHTLTGEPPLVAIVDYQEGGATAGLEARQEATQHTMPAVACLLAVRPLDVLAVSYTGS
jgi:hypothetical protein